jgi:hypothetical protein
MSRPERHASAPSPLIPLVRALAALAEAEDYARVKQETRHHETPTNRRRREA